MHPVQTFIVAVAALPLAIASAQAQSVAPGAGPLQLAQAKPQQPQAAPAKPYKPVSVKLPAPLADPSFEAFRKQLGEAATKKDRAALGKLVVAQGFFWETENGDKADKKKPGIENLATALGLARKDTDGWDMLMGYSVDPTAMPFPEKQGVICAPADPVFEDKELEDVAKATGTDPGEWGFPLADGVEVRAAAQANAAVAEKLGLHFVRVLPDMPKPAPNQPPMLKIVTPSGKTGFIPAEMLAPLGNDQLCYVKDGDGWKIAGFIGGEQ